MRFGENPKQVIDKVKERLKVVEKGLPKGVKVVPFYDRTELIENTIGTVYSALSEEIVITVVVILLFLLHFQLKNLACIYNVQRNLFQRFRSYVQNVSALQPNVLLTP